MKMHSVWQYRGIFNVSLSKAHYDTNFATRDKMRLMPVMPKSHENKN